MICHQCKEECCLRNFCCYSKGKYYDPMETPTHFIIRKDYPARGYQRFIDISFYNNEILVANMNRDGWVRRYFNTVSEENFYKSTIFSLFRSLERSCKSHEFIAAHNISFEEIEELK